jgi:hypothetical protein
VRFCAFFSSLMPPRTAGLSATQRSLSLLPCLPWPNASICASCSLMFRARNVPRGQRQRIPHPSVSPDPFDPNCR